MIFSINIGTTDGATNNNEDEVPAIGSEEDAGEALASGANDIVVVKQSDGSFQATTLQVKIGKMTNIKTIFRSREGRKAQLQVNNLLVLPETEIEIGDSGNAFFLRSENGRNFTFTSDELAEMNLNDGLNEAIFVIEELNIRLTFSIFLLNQGNRIVFTDVDGTITTADIKGYIAGELGFDTHHEGVVELFEQIDKNGYTMIYLSARPMGSFNEDTREYLFEQLRPNDKGFSLPISPLFLSNVLLFEGISEASDPSETKIATIRSIVEMFDLKEHVVSAGYGNQESDAEAYLKSGIEARKIFMVNKQSKMVNYGTGEPTSYKNQVENVDTMYPTINPINKPPRAGVTDL